MSIRVLILIAAGAGLAAAQSAAPGAEKCAGLAALDAKALPNPTTVLTSTKLNPPKAAGRNLPAQPEHCEVLGKMDERTGANGQRYAIRFHLRLPTNWNGRFFFEGGGGSNGNLGMALGNLQGREATNALALGYAVVSQDSGHDNAVNNDPRRGGTVTFGFDEQARVDFGYRSYDQVTQAAKALIRAYYGKAPERSYYVGCSEGGREAMMMSQRFPAYFDGILACAPGFHLPKAAVFGHSWDAQALAEVAKAAGISDRNGEPFLNKTFTDEDLKLAADAVLAACDELDGLKDGIIENLTGCATARVIPKLAAITCSGAKQSSCLSAAQAKALEKIMAGPKNAQGELLYSDWQWDAGIGSPGWRVWKMGMYDAPANSAIIATLGSASVSTLFVTPPTEVATTGGAPLEHLLAVDFEREAPKLSAKTGEYRESVLEFMKADSTDLAPFRAHGGKLVIVHGASDPVFSYRDTAQWWNEVNRVNHGRAAEFVRLFAVPGMNHCTGGPATDQFDAFGALVEWVEKGKAPERIVATAGPASPWPGRTRPLCAYPKQAYYKGEGNIEDAASFVCR
ncbi:MAG TPA: tannase/feruloyl esterase family alpha/beta hydrolase [Bryobacteraceae bacterium]|nr:tannase/feruloyl esterase family alpha/beta hydrolase [Bryobacteraceae bacterium]